MDRQYGYYYICRIINSTNNGMQAFAMIIFSVTSLRDKYGYKAPNAEIAYTPQITYKPSEFSYIRASFERRFTKDFTIETSKIDFRPIQDQLRDFYENQDEQKTSPTVVSSSILYPMCFLFSGLTLHMYIKQKLWYL